MAMIEMLALTAAVTVDSFINDAATAVVQTAELIDAMLAAALFAANPAVVRRLYYGGAS